jgi:hypothetical protein
MDARYFGTQAESRRDVLIDGNPILLKEAYYEISHNPVAKYSSDVHGMQL